MVLQNVFASLDIWEGLRWLIHNASTRGHLSTIYSKSGAHNGQTQDLILPMASQQVDHTPRLYHTILPCASPIRHEYSLLIIVFYHHRISVDIIKPPPAR